MNHYPRHVGDYLRDTVDLTMLEDGAYTRLLDQYYARDEPLPADKGKVYRMARAISKPERAAVDSVLRQFFVLGSTGWRNKRADLELDEQRERSASASESAKRRWEKRYATAHANAPPNALPTQSEGICDTDADTHANDMLASSQEPGAIPPDATHQSGNGPKNGKERATRLSPDWRLPAEWKVWAIEAHNLEPERVVRISLSFRDFWIAKPGREGTKLDWPATWRNWVRREVGDA